MQGVVWSQVYSFLPGSAAAVQTLWAGDHHSFEMIKQLMLPEKPYPSYFKKKTSTPAELCGWWRKCKNIMWANVTICGWMSDLSAWQSVMLEGEMLCISSTSLAWIAEVLTQVTVVDYVHFPLLGHIFCGGMTEKFFSKLIFLSFTCRLESKGVTLSEGAGVPPDRGSVRSPDCWLLVGCILLSWDTFTVIIASWKLYCWCKT